MRVFEQTSEAMFSYIPTFHAAYRNAVVHRFPVADIRHNSATVTFRHRQSNEFLILIQNPHWFPFTLKVIKRKLKPPSLIPCDKKRFQVVFYLEFLTALQETP